MLRTIIILIVSAGVIFLVGKYLFDKNNENLSKLSSPGQSIYLVIQSGDVYYKLPNQTEFVKSTSSPIAIPNQTIVKTKGGFASIILPSSSVISLSTSTEIAINYSTTSTTIFQSIGQTYHRVQKLITGETYQVQTPGTLAAVRGTKFGVAYNPVLKVTKVSVTENLVSVSKIKKEFDIKATSTEDLGIGAESILVEAGKIAKVIQKPESGKPAIEVINEKDETEKDFKEWIDKNKKTDPKYDEKIKEESRTETKERILIELLDEEAKELEIKTDDTQETEIKSDTEPTETRTETQIRTTNTGATTQNSTQNTVNTQTATAPVGVVLGEEEFFNKFIPLYEDNFYLDENDRACRVSRIAAERVKIIADFGTANKRPFDTTRLSDFAKRVEEYCKSNKDARVKAELQIKFDEEFPYQ